MKSLKLVFAFLALCNYCTAQFSIGKISQSKKSSPVELNNVHQGNLVRSDYINLSETKDLRTRLITEELIEFPTASEGVFVLKRTDVLQTKNGVIWKGDIISGPKGYGNVFYYKGTLSGTIYTSGKVFKLDAQSVSESRLVEIAPNSSENYECGISHESNNSNDDQFKEPSFEIPGLEEIPPATNTQVDVMILYPASVEASMGGAQAMDAEVNYRIAEINQVFVNSEINITMNVVHHQATSAVKTAATSASDVLVYAVEQLRNQYNADIVAHWNDGGSAGSGYNLDGSGDPDDGYNTSNFSDVQTRYTFIHECGHNMGAKHDRQTYYDSSPTSSKLNLTPYYRYGKSFIGYRSIMSYASCGAAGGSDSNCDRVPYFTNPDIMVNGAPFGVSGNYQTYSPNGPANNALRLNGTASIVAAWRQGVDIEYFNLIVNNGIGDGDYTENESVVIVADNPVSGKVFNYWSGDVQYVTNVNAATTTISMPDENISVTAVYRDMNATDEVFISKRISASNDDVEESGDGSGNMYVTSSDLEMTLDGSKGNQTIGLLFRNVEVPDGMDISEASIEFVADATNSEATNLTISADESISSNDFLTTAFDVSTRIQTTNSVAWTPGSWSTEGTYDSPDLKSVIQELVEGQNWQSGSNIVFVIEGTGVRSAYSFDGEPNKAPLLKLKYKLANQAPVLTSVTDQTTEINTPIEILMSMITASDAENDGLSIILGAGNNYTISNGSIVPNQGFVGDLFVPIKVADSGKQSNELIMKISVTTVTSSWEINQLVVYGNVVYFDLNNIPERINVYSIEGSLVQQIPPANKIDLNNLSLPTGVYILKTQSNNVETNTKFFLK